MQHTSTTPKKAEIAILISNGPQNKDITRNKGGNFIMIKK